VFVGRRSAGRAFGWALAVILCLGMLFGGDRDVRAQTKPAPPPAVLTAVESSNVSAGETKFVLTFAPGAPQFSLVDNDSQKPAIAFALTSRGDGARVAPALRGIVRSVTFDQVQTVLILRLDAAGRAQITAERVGDRVIILSVTPAGAVHSSADAEHAAPAPKAPVALPKAAEIGTQDGFEVVPLKYADVSEVVGLLAAGASIKSNDGFVPHEPAFGSAGMNGGYVAAQTASPDGDNEPMGQSVDEAIGVDRRLNAIILKGTPERIAELKARIAAIDVPVESVVLETMFVELTESGARNVGLDFNNANAQLGVATFQMGGYIPPTSYGVGAGKGLTSLSLQAAIYAQVQKGRGRIVSKPRIAAQSGGTAKIITGDALPILTAITLSGVNGVSQQVQYVNVGVTLQIAPRVSEDGYVTSHVFGVVSSVTGYSQGYPTISQREASTSATVHDGDTFVIGGLTEENEISAKGAVPGLGGIPIAGQFFHLEKSTSSKTELYIVVTPHIIHRGQPSPVVPSEVKP
jgi:general secretion pathway protein D